MVPFVWKREMNWKTQLYGLIFGIGIAVLVGVAGSLADVEDLQTVSVWAVLATAVRSAATAILTLLGSKVPGVTAE